MKKKMLIYSIVAVVVTFASLFIVPHVRSKQCQISRKVKQMKHTIQELEQQHKCKILIVVTSRASSIFVPDLEDHMLELKDGDGIARFFSKIVTQHTDQPSLPDVHIIFHTNGGLVSTSIKNAINIQNYQGRVQAYVPYTSKSGGTMMANACNSIYFGPMGALGPVDCQLQLKNGHIYSFRCIANAHKMAAASEQAALRNFSITYEDVLAAENVLVHQNTCVKIIKQQLNPNNHQELLDLMTNGNIIHEFPFTYSFLSQSPYKEQMGRPIYSTCPKAYIDLIDTIEMLAGKCS